MQITNKFTIGVHVICAIEYFKKNMEVTSSLLSLSTGANPVTVRTVISELREAGLIDISQGKTGIGLKKNIKEITMLDVFKGVKCLEDDGLFHFHDNPNMDCPVGKNIHKALDDKLIKIEESLYKGLEGIKLGDVYDDIIKELKGEENE